MCLFVYLFISLFLYFFICLFIYLFIVSYGQMRLSVLSHCWLVVRALNRCLSVCGRMCCGQTCVRAPAIWTYVTTHAVMRHVAASSATERCQATWPWSSAAVQSDSVGTPSTTSAGVSRASRAPSSAPVRSPRQLVVVVHFAWVLDDAKCILVTRVCVYWFTAKWQLFS